MTNKVTSDIENGDWDLLDDEEEPQWFTNYYHHLDCLVQPGIEWEDEWDATCNDECPACGSGDIEPYKSEDL